ncbi:hypothetical protein X975_20118, partial [Stegodyphus mimosarum]
MEQFFVLYHGEKFQRGSRVIKDLVEKLKLNFAELDEKIIQTYVKIGTFIRIKYLNNLMNVKSVER